MLKRIFILLLASLTAVSAVSCGAKETDEPADTSAPAETEQNDEFYESDLSRETFDGYDFRMSMGWVESQYITEDNGDNIDAAVYYRNKTVEDKYGITISCAAQEAGGNYNTEALNALMAGDDCYDLIGAHSRAAFVYATSGVCMNAYDIAALHLDKPWWSADAVSTFTLNDRLYVLDGDISYPRLSNTMCLLFNKEIFDANDLEYPYAAVKDGSWTFDKFGDLVKVGVYDLDGNSVLERDNDQFGLVCGGWGTPIDVIYMANIRVCDKDSDGNLQLSLNSDKTARIFETFFKILDSDAVCFTDKKTGSLSGADMFRSGKAMFIGESFNGAKLFRDMDDEFGIIPYPKFDRGDDYHTAINGAAPLLFIPFTVSDPERTGAVIEALCAYSSRDIIPQYYETALKGKYSRDNDSEEMLDLIKDSIIYDIGYLASCGGNFASLGRSLALSENHDFASFYAANEKSVETAIRDFSRDYGGMDD